MMLTSPTTATAEGILMLVCLSNGKEAELCMSAARVDSEALMPESSGIHHMAPDCKHILVPANKRARVSPTDLGMVSCRFVARMAAGATDQCSSQERRTEETGQGWPTELQA